MKITGMSRVDSRALRLRHTSNPLRPGMIASSKIRSGCTRAARCRPSSPPCATSMRKFWASMYSTMSAKLAGVSSMMRMVGATMVPRSGGALIELAPGERKGAGTQHRLDRFRCDRGTVKISLRLLTTQCRKNFQLALRLHTFRDGFQVMRAGKRHDRRDNRMGRAIGCQAADERAIDL